MPLNPEVKEQWLTALRSGDYKQGKSALKTGPDAAPRHCCLGVLCEVAVEAGVIPAPVKTYSDWKYGNDQEWSWASLPKSVLEWAGLEDDEHDPRVVTGSRSTEATTAYYRENLSQLNDSGHTFNEIANLIEKWL